MFKNIQKYVRLSLFISRPFVPLSCLFKTAILYFVQTVGLSKQTELLYKQPHLLINRPKMA